MEKIEDDKIQDLSHRVLKYFEAMHFSPMDTVDVELVYMSFTSHGTVRCPDSISGFSEKMLKVLSEGRHPTLNPFIDKLKDHAKEGAKPTEVLKNFIQQTGDFTAQEIDNKKSYLQIKIKGSFLWCNLKVIAKEPDIMITRAVIQTALFKKEIKA